MRFTNDMKDSRQIGYSRRMSAAHEQAVLLADLLVGRSQMLAVAESCTGGWVAKCLTDLAGSSRWFDRGFVTYTNESKVALAISGIAGPGGAVAGKPVGTVCFAWALRSGYRLAETCRFEGDRDAVRQQAVVHALARLVTILQDG
jgi:nicotinamide-nucleotide amidase